jgi:hypothetical protein
MKHQLTIMGHTIMVNYEAAGNGLQIIVDQEQQASFESYLKRSLPYYVSEPDSDHPLNTRDLPFEKLLEIAINFENQNPEKKITEPTTKLPYDLPVSTKDMLIKLAQAQGISATQLTINLIDKKHKNVVKK